MEQRGHFSDLDGMRGVLSVTVMIFHFGLNVLLGRVTGGLIDHANWGLCVDFFFMLSGFVLCRSYCRRRVPVGEYFARRLFRLAPMYYLTLLVALAVFPRTLSVAAVTANAAMVAPFLRLPSANGPSWSVPYELFLPIVILLLAPYLARRSVKIMGGALAALVVLSAANGILAPTAEESIIRPSLGLSAGMFLYLVYRRYPAKASRPRTYAAFGVAFFSIMFTSIWPAAYAVFFPASVAAIYFGAPTKTILSSAPLQALGRWSYSIYLIHFPLMNLAIMTLGTATVSGSVPIKGAWVAVTIALAAAAYRWIEAPMIKAGARR